MAPQDAAVVGDPQEDHAALPQLYHHLVCPGVHGVFQQLFHHGSRPLHHLAGSDEIGQMGG